VDGSTMDRLLTVRETAVRLGLTEDTVRKWASTGRLTKVLIGPQTVRIPLSSVERFIEERTVRKEGRS